MLYNTTGVSKYFLPIYPPPLSIILFYASTLNRKLVNFNFNWIWELGLKHHPPSLSRSKIEMLVFGLCSTSDDWPNNLSKKCRLKCKKKQKRPPKSSKNKMFVFGLLSTSDDWPSDLSKMQKSEKGPLSH